MILAWDFEALEFRATEGVQADALLYFVDTFLLLVILMSLFCLDGELLREILERTETSSPSFFLESTFLTD